MQVKEILLRAADLLEEKGHVKRALKNEEGRMCALGSIIEAQGHNAFNISPYATDRLTHEPALAILKSLGRDTDPVWGPQSPIAEWNNAPDITGAEVIKAMRKAAEALDKEKVDAV